MIKREIKIGDLDSVSLYLFEQSFPVNRFAVRNYKIEAYADGVMIL